MFGLSLGEVLFLGIIALIVIGPKQLPELARNLGRFLNELKRATDGFTTDLKDQAKIDFDLHPRPRRFDPPPDLAVNPPPLADDSPSEHPDPSIQPLGKNEGEPKE